MSGPDNENADNTPDYVSQAKEMGWVEKEHFRGDESKWVDAKEFVDRGEHFFPLIKAQNKRLKQDLLTRDAKINSLEQTLTDVQKSMGALQKHYTEATKREVDQAKKDLVTQIKVARESGDTDLEFLLQDKLGDLREAQKEAGKVEEDSDKKTGKQDEVDKSKWNPEFLDWNKENDWFGDMEDVTNRKRTKALLRIGEDLRDDGDTSAGRVFMEKCMAILEKQESGNTGNTKRTPSKVEGGSPGRSAGGGRGFDSLPKEAKDACHSDNDRFVGPNKLFKSVKEWEDSFYEQYASQE